MLVWWISLALAAPPRSPPPAPPPPREVACAMDHLADGRVRWSRDGVVDLLYANGKVLRSVELDTTLPPEVAVRCKGAEIELFASVPHATLGFHEIRLDMTDVLQSLVPPDEVELACQAARAHLRAGSPSDAAARIASSPAGDPRVAALRVEIARASVTRAKAAPPNERLSLLAPALAALGAPGWPAAEQQAAQLLAADALAADGRTSEAIARYTELLGADPRLAAALLGRGDARWTLGDKVGSKADYTAYVALVPAADWPATLRERCRSCKP